MHTIYFDNASTTKMFPEVIAQLHEEQGFLYGNPASRFHSAGWEAEDKVNEARVFIASYLGASPEELVFTSGASESIKLVFNHFFWNHQVQIVTNRTEHKITLLSAESLAKKGWQVAYISVDKFGYFNWFEDKKKLELGNSYLFVFMLGNNEIGTLNNLKIIVQDIRENFRNAFILTDATQAVTKIQIDFHALDVDFLVFSAHKFHGPKGVGGLLVKKNISFLPFGIAENQERGRRGGTLNVMGIRGMYLALRKAIQCDINLLSERRNRFEELIQHEINEVELVGSRKDRLPQISNLFFKGIYSEDFLQALSDVAASNGSACNSAAILPSHVLLAIGKTDEQALSCVRFSFSFMTTDEEIEIGSKHIIEIIKRRWRK